MSYYILYYQLLPIECGLWIYMLNSKTNLELEKKHHNDVYLKIRQKDVYLQIHQFS